MCDVQERLSSMKMLISLCVDTLSMVRCSALKTSWCLSWARVLDPYIIYIVLL